MSARRTKILATLGPASREPAVLEQMMAAGLDAVRLNFSHGTLDWHRDTLERVRAASEKTGRAVAILQDLQGPKVRIGKVKGQMTLRAGDRLVITTRQVEGGGGIVSTDYAALPGDVAPGTRILLDEGRIAVIVREVNGPEVVCEVADGGVLSSNKGINIPGAALTASSMTDKDRADVRAGLSMGVDYVALSMVRKAADIEDLRQLMAQAGRSVPIVAKIEKPQAVAAIEEIVGAADGVMVARGDLGIEVSLEMVPVHQKAIIACANRAGKLVITATQMLESMTNDAVPTRAEVTDVANAILDGTDAVMLSGETAVGEYPVETVRRMAAIADATEQHLYPFERSIRGHIGDIPIGHALARIAAQASRDVGAKAIVVFTSAGRTAMRLSDERPRAPIVAFTREQATARRLALYWGVHPRAARDVRGPDLLAAAEQYLIELGFARAGDPVVFVLGSHTAPGAANSVRIATLGESEP